MVIDVNAPLRAEDEYGRIKRERGEDVAERFRKEITPYTREDGTVTATATLDAEGRALLDGRRPLVPGFRREVPHSVPLKAPQGILDAIEDHKHGYRN